MYEFRRLGLPDWEALRDIRLRALDDSPMAFGSEWAIEEAWPQSRWEESIHRNSWIVATKDDRSVAMIGGYVPSECPHRLNVIGVWVAPEERGAGLAGRLIDHVAAIAKQLGSSELSLAVVDGNDRARQTFERSGFKDCGESFALTPEKMCRRMVRPVTQQTEV